MGNDVNLKDDSLSEYGPENAIKLILDVLNAMGKSKKILQTDPNIVEFVGAKGVHSSDIINGKTLNVNKLENNGNFKLKVGALCEVYDKEKGIWTEGEIVESFSNENGIWVKVRCGLTVYEHKTDDPDLRIRMESESRIGISGDDQMSKMNQSYAPKIWIHSECPRALTLFVTYFRVNDVVQSHLLYFQRAISGSGRYGERVR